MAGPKQTARQGTREKRLQRDPDELVARSLTSTASELSGQPGESGPSEKELRDRHLSRLVDLYKHHYDLFVKGYLFYLAIVSAIASVVFGNNDKTSVKTYLMILAAVISGLSAFSCLNAVEWVNKTKGKIGRLTEKLSLEEIHFVEAGRFIYVLMILSSVIGLFFLSMLFVE
jgi:hypothetical protein